MSGNVLVTGISRGLGLEIARQLLADGWTVYGVLRRETDETMALAERYPRSLRTGRFDLEEMESLGGALFGEDGFLAKGVELHGLVNNAAMAVEELVTDLRGEALERLFRVNLLAPMLLARQAIRRMLLHGTAGTLVHVSSVCAHRGYAGLAAYAATKAGLEGFSRSVAREWGRRGIRSNAVAAGFMETRMSASLGPAQRESIRRRAALGRATNVASVAATVVYLLSPRAGSITGETIMVDSGGG